MAPIGSAHTVAVNRPNRLLVATVGERGVVSVQNPVRPDSGSEPQSDVAILRAGADAIGVPIPSAAAVLLVIEVADATLHDDRMEKGPLYAAGGVPEYWILNLPEQLVEVYCDPQAGRYRSVRTVGTGGVLDMTLLPGVTLAVPRVLGTPAA